VALCLLRRITTWNSGAGAPSSRLWDVVVEQVGGIVSECGAPQVGNLDERGFVPTPPE
jgi:hypothetical protein